MITRNIKVPTGNICIMKGDKGLLEFLSIGDYGKSANVKADFLGLKDDIQGVPNGVIQPLEDKWVITLSTQYGCSMDCTFCLPPGEPVLMHDYSNKNIEDIRLGDVVIANQNASENKQSHTKQYATFLTKNAKVTGVIKRYYVGDMYTIKTKDGNSIICTGEHPLATNHKSRYLFKDAMKMKVGDAIIVGRETRLSNIKNADWRLGWLFGFIYGDGVYDEINGRRWQVSQKYKYVLDFMCTILDENGIHHSNIWEQKDGEYGVSYRFAIQGKNVGKMESIAPKTPHDAYKKGYIAGFWDAEGYSFKNNQIARVCGTNMSELQMCEKYMSDLGYASSYQRVAKKIKGYHKDCYVLNFKISRDEFNEKFTPIHKKRLFLEDKRSSGFSSLSKIIEITSEPYKGLVYNIETTEHNYYASNILTHNCDVPKVGRGINATYDDLKNQIISAISLHPEVKYTERLNIHYARMGEPTWNDDVLNLTLDLKDIIKPFLGESLVHPVISTMLPRSNKYLMSYLLEWVHIKNHIFDGDAGLQFSINSTSDSQREEMFSGNSLTLAEISEIGRRLPDPKGRKYALNFALADGYEVDAEKLRTLFNPNKFMVKITPLHKTLSCEENDIKTTDGYEYFTPYKQVEKDLIANGFDVLVFIPSYDEDLGRITCGNAILSGSIPECEYEEVKR